MIHTHKKHDDKEFSWHVLSNLTDKEKIDRFEDNEFSINYSEAEAIVAIRGLKKKRMGEYWYEKRPILKQFP